MSVKDCNHQEHKWRMNYRRLCGALLTFFGAVLIALLMILWILQPKKPTFTLQDATILEFNQSSPELLTSKIQVTIASRNPNKRIGVYYDSLRFFASYKDQRITMDAKVESTYQGHKEVIVWSTFLVGEHVPISPTHALALPHDRAGGSVFITVKADGRARFRVGSIVTGHYHIFVMCQTYIRFGSGNNQMKIINNMQRCKVDV